MKTRQMIRPGQRGKLGRRDVARALLALGIVPVMSPMLPHGAMASETRHATDFTGAGSMCTSSIRITWTRMATGRISPSSVRRRTG